MSTYDHRSTAGHDVPSAPSPGRAPGKRTLTQALPRSRPLADQRRTVADFFAGSGADIGDTRETIDAQADHGPELTDQQIATAKRRNPHWIGRLKVSPQIVSNATADSAAFAFDVAAAQAAQGLKVDGIFGPKTATAVGAVAMRERAAPRPSASAAVDDGIADTRATIDADPFGGEDPFAMHLIGNANDET